MLYSKLAKLGNFILWWPAGVWPRFSTAKGLCSLFLSGPTAEASNFGQSSEMPSWHKPQWCTRLPQLGRLGRRLPIPATPVRNDSANFLLNWWDPSSGNQRLWLYSSRPAMLQEGSARSDSIANAMLVSNPCVGSLAKGVAPMHAGDA